MRSRSPAACPRGVVVVNARTTTRPACTHWGRSLRPGDSSSSHTRSVSHCQMSKRGLACQSVAVPSLFGCIQSSAKLARWLKPRSSPPQPPPATPPPPTSAKPPSSPQAQGSSRVAPDTNGSNASQRSDSPQLQPKPGSPPQPQKPASPPQPQKPVSPPLQQPPAAPAPQQVGSRCPSANVSLVCAVS